MYKRQISYKLQPILAKLQDRCAVFGKCILKCGQIKVCDRCPVSYTHLDVYKRQVFGKEKLIDAMEHPEKEEYANFTIRVSGYAVKFIEMWIRDRPNWA